MNKAIYGELFEMVQYYRKQKSGGE